MSQQYKGLTIPEYSDPADGPMSFQLLVDSGPIPRFATAGDRDIAIPTPVEGQIVYRADLKHTETYNGTAWTSMALPLSGGTMTGTLNMASNEIQNLPNPSGVNQPVPLGFADARYRNHSEAVPYSSVSGVPWADSDTRGITRVFNNLTSHDVNEALSANMGRILDQSKLDKASPTGQGQMTIGSIEMSEGWGISDAPDGFRIHKKGTNYYEADETKFRPIAHGARDLGASTAAWRNLYYTGSLVKPSSAALKEDIAPYEFDALSLIDSVPPKSFRWRGTDHRDIGFIAEDLPSPISRDINGVNHLLPDQLIVTLWQAVRQLSARLAALGV